MTENSKLRKATSSAFYNISQRNFGILLNFCLDLFRSKFSLLRKWSILCSQITGIVVNTNNDMLFSVRFYDGREDVIPREEVYHLGHEKFSADVEFIVRCEESLVGKAVVARNDADGFFYLGEFLQLILIMMVTKWGKEGWKLES